MFMRILQINKFFYRRGGSESYFFDLSELLARNGHEVIHFAVKNSQNKQSQYDKFFVDEINFDRREGFLKDFRKFFHSLYSFEARKKLESLILETRPEVAHLHNISHHLSPSILTTLKKNKIPVIQTLHDYQLFCPNFKMFTQGEICERCRKYKYWNAVLYKCIHGSRVESLAEGLEMFVHKTCQIYENSVYCFVTPSEFLKEKMVYWGAGGKGKIEVVPNFVDNSVYEPNYTPGNYILYFGRLAKEKGLDVLIEAMSYGNMKLKIAGEGPEKDDLRAKVEKYKLEEKVEFIGYKSGRELNDFIRGSRFVVLPAIWHENYPVSLLEAAATGKALIGSRLGGIPEIIKDGENGFLSEAGNARDLWEKMGRLWEDDDLCEKMGRRARDMVLEKNSPEEHYKRIIEIYKRLTTDDKRQKL